MQPPILICGDVAYGRLAAVETLLAKETGRVAGFSAAEPWLVEKLHLIERDLEDAFAPLAARWFLRRELNKRIAFLCSEISRAPEMRYLYAVKRAKIEERLAALGNPRATEERLRRVDSLFSKFERHIATREFASGASWTMVDAIWTASIDRLFSLGFREIVNGERHPYTNQYFARMRQRKSFCLLHLGKVDAFTHAVGQMLHSVLPNSDAPPALVNRILKIPSVGAASTNGAEFKKTSGGAI